MVFGRLGYGGLGFTQRFSGGPGGGGAAPEWWLTFGDSLGNGMDAWEAQDEDMTGVKQDRFRAPIGPTSDVYPLDQRQDPATLSPLTERLSPYHYFAKQRAQNIGADVYLIPFNYPGSSFGTANSFWGAGTDYTNELVNRANAAIQRILAVAPNCVPGGIISTIGTNNANTGVSAATTVAQLSPLIDDLRARIFVNGLSGATLGTTYPFYLTGLLPEGINTTARQGAEIGQRMLAQQRAADNVKFYKVPEGRNRGADTIHYGNPGIRLSGPEMANLLSDESAPTSSFPLTYTLLSDQKLLLNLTDTLNEYAWCTLSGAGASNFEIVQIDDGTTGILVSRMKQYLRFNGDTTKAVGSYSVTINATNGNGRTLSFTFAVTVSAAYGTQVEDVVPTHRTFFSGAVTKDGRNRPNIPVNLGRGKNLIQIQNLSGPLTDISSVTFNGIAATRDANSNATADTYLFYLNSAVDQSGTLVITPSGGSDNVASMEVVIASVVGTTDAVASSSVMANAARFSTDHQTASLTCPAGGVIIGLGMIPAPTTIKTGCTELQKTGNLWSQYRTTDGVCGYTGGHNQFSRFAAAAFAKAT